MSTKELDSYEITKRAFASVEALVKDALGNATLTGDPKRLHIGAAYLRLAGRKSAALADLITGVANQNRPYGLKAIKRLEEIDRDIQKHLDRVAVDNKRWAEEKGSVRMQVSGEELEALMRGEQPPELIARIEQAQEEPEAT